MFLFWFSWREQSRVPAEERRKNVILPDFRRLRPGLPVEHTTRATQSTGSLRADLKERTHGHRTGSHGPSGGGTTSPSSMGHPLPSLCHLIRKRNEILCCCELDKSPRYKTEIFLNTSTREWMGIWHLASSASCHPQGFGHPSVIRIRAIHVDSKKTANNGPTRLPKFEI
jgi:hypothetical protein